MPIERTLALQVLTNRFSAGELQTLCFELGMDDEELPGKTHEDKARELIRYLERRDCLGNLVTAGARLRPDVRWDDADRMTADAGGPPAAQASRGDVEIRDVAQIGNPLIRAWHGVSARISRVLQIGGRIEIGGPDSPQEPRRP